MVANPGVYGLRKFYRFSGAGPTGATLSAIGNDVTDTCSLMAICTVYSNQKFYFRDSGLYVYSSADGQLDIVADITVAISGATTMNSTLAVTGIFTSNGGITMGDAKNIILNTTTGTKIGTATSQKLGFFNAAPVIQASAMTGPLTNLTHTAPGTDDFAIQDLVQSTSPTAGEGFGFVTKDEGNTVLKVIQANKIHIAEIEAILNALGFCAT